MIFIDTGPWLARYVERDQYHSASQAGWNALRDDRVRLFTSNFVLDELLTLLARRAGASFAAARAHSIHASRVLTILRSDADDEKAAIAKLEKFSDQALSFTDCVSFRLMERYRLRRAFTFDQHFAMAGLEVWSPGAG